MKIRITNGIWIGLAIGVLKRDVFLGMLIAAALEVMSITLINLFWFFKGYVALEAGSFMASIILPNTSPYRKDFAYQEVLLRTYIRTISLVCMILWPVTWPIFLIIFILTLLHK